MRVVVVGGGIAGLAAAQRLRELSPDLEVVVLEQARRLGGKIHTRPLAGLPVETGAETFLLRENGEDSEVLALARRVGLGEDLLHPAPVPAALAFEGGLHPLPGGTLMGVPADPASVAAVAHVTDKDHDGGRPLIAPGEDVAVGTLVRERLGDEVVDRLVDPLLGGVYAGRADELSLEATMPGLHRAAQRESTLASAVRRALAESPRRPGAPVFASVRGGLSQLVAAVAAAARAEVRVGETVRHLESVQRTGSPRSRERTEPRREAERTWLVTTGPTTNESTLAADGVVLAIPAAPAARLLRAVDPEAAATVGLLQYASVALVTLVLPPSTRLPELSGFLVPATEHHAVKAATFFTRKWPHLADGGPVLLRASVGRHGDQDVLRHTDTALAGLVREELPALLGMALPDPAAVRVTRWGGGLPQYGVGHVGRVAGVRSVLPPTLALAGAACDGVGIAACVRSGQAAAESVWAALLQ